jgi:mono/diheme cytochrome c family protein
MNRPIKIAGAVVALFLLTGVLVAAWSGAASERILSRTFEVHAIDFPIPFPLTEEEVSEAGLAPEEVEDVYACSDCHGADFGGGVMVDSPPIGSLLGPNLTLGEGSRTLGYTPADWDAIVRHGVRADGLPAVMPSSEFVSMSDQELSDIIVYIRTQPPVDAAVPERKLGPLGKFLLARGDLPLSADRMASLTQHDDLPPVADVTLAFGEHLAAPCSGCHGQELAGGAIPGGDPSWAPARNLTPHGDGLAGWSFEDFEGAMRSGVRPDGTALLMPMTLALPYTANLTDVEMRALWLYLESLDPMATPR